MDILVSNLSFNNLYTENSSFYFLNTFNFQINMNLTFYALIFISFVASSLALTLRVTKNHLQHSRIPSVDNMKYISQELKQLREYTDNQLSAAAWVLQDYRITKLENLILQIRTKQMLIYNQSVLADSKEDKCLSFSPAFKNQLEGNLQNITKDINAIGTGLPSQTNLLLNNIKNTNQYLREDIANISAGLSPFPGSISNRTNFLAEGWKINNYAMKEIGQQYVSNSSNLINICPLETPFVSSDGLCIKCQCYDVKNRI